MSSITVYKQFTLAELAKQMNNGEVLEIAEVLAEQNEILQDAVWIEANQIASHVGTKRKTLPTGTWRRANQGVAVESSTTAQVTEPIGRLEALADIDEAILDLAINKQQVRKNNDKAFLEGLSQNLADAVFYGNLSTDPEKFNGLAARFDALSDSNVLGAGGTGDDTTSLWIIEWGPMSFHMIYPLNSKAGIDFSDKGKVRVDDGTNPYYAYESQFVVQAGIYVHDDRCCQRIANIETSGADNTLDDDDVIEALNLLPKAGGNGATMIYVNRTIKTQMEIMAKDKANVNYSADTAFGVPITRFRGIPVRLCEALVNTETAIT
jgi:hypothetical protein